MISLGLPALGPKKSKTESKKKKKAKIDCFSTILTLFRLRFGLFWPPGPGGPGKSFLDSFSNVAPEGPNDPCSGQKFLQSYGSLDGRNRAIVIAEALARVIVAIRIASVHWRSYLPPEAQKLVLTRDPAFVVLRFGSRDWRPFVQHSFHVELRNGLREMTSAGPKRGCLNVGA